MSRLGGLLTGLCLLSVSGAPLPATAQAQAAFDYKACTQQVWRQPEATFERAIASASLGGGPMATRCAALALFALEQFGPAAARFIESAESTGVRDPKVKAEIYGQASQAAIMADQFGLALRTINAAVALAPHILSYRIDRGIVYGHMRQPAQAIEDFNFVLTRLPNDLVTLTYRGAALRQLGRFADAVKDLDFVLERAPEEAPALLERGRALYGLGERQAALQDWVTLARAHPHTPAADTAQALIQHVENQRIAR